MNYEHQYRNIQDQHLSGLGVQYYIAFRNNLILRELREIKPCLKEDTPQYILDLFLFLADSAKRDTILSLSKIFDRSSKRNNKLRNINKFLNQLKSHEDELFSVIELFDNNWDDFKKQHSKIIIKYPKLDIDKENFIYVVEEIISSLQENGNIIDKLRVWRDKVLAHNELYLKEISLEYDEIETLFEISYLVFEIYNRFLRKGTVILNLPKISFVRDVFKDFLI
jgi:hypothetical protein